MKSLNMACSFSRDVSQSINYSPIAKCSPELQEKFGVHVKSQCCSETGLWQFPALKPAMVLNDIKCFVVFLSVQEARDFSLSYQVSVNDKDLSVTAVCRSRI